MGLNTGHIYVEVLSLSCLGSVHDRIQVYVSRVIKAMRKQAVAGAASARPDQNSEEEKSMLEQ